MAVSRFLACVSVEQIHVDGVLNGPPSEEWDGIGEGFVNLVSVNEDEGYTCVGVSYLMPHVYSMVHSIGWHSVDVGEEDVFCH